MEDVKTYKIDFKHEGEKYFDIITAFTEEEALERFYETRGKDEVEVVKILELKI